ncbi:hypothetical protein TNCV_2216291 [Trichonephila clavipes]|nr:hypothetical protein TNCV_2216291 [Trichonephila clavipes]
MGLDAHLKLLKATTTLQRSASLKVDSPNTLENVLILTSCSARHCFLKPSRNRTMEQPSTGRKMRGRDVINLAFTTRERRKFWVLRTDLNARRKNIFGSRAAIEFSFREGERLAQRRSNRSIVFTECPEGKRREFMSVEGKTGQILLIGSSAAIEFIFEATSAKAGQRPHLLKGERFKTH